MAANVVRQLRTQSSARTDPPRAVRPYNQCNFVVDVAAPEPVNLTEHDAYAWRPVSGDLPVTDAVRAVLEDYKATASNLRECA